MANSKISALPIATALQGDEAFALVQSGTTKRTTLSDIDNYVIETHITVADGNTINLSDSTYTSSTLIKLTFTATGGVENATVNLPNANGTNTNRLIRFISDTTFTSNTRVSLTPTNGATIDGSSSAYIINKEYEGVQLWSDGTEWFIVQKKAWKCKINFNKRYINMKSNEVLNQIKTVLGMEVNLEENIKEVKLESLKLENGTILEAESFEKGKDVFIVTEDEKVALPVGEYTLEDSRMLLVEAEGKIADLREVGDEVPEETEDLVEEDLSEKVEETKETELEEEADVADWQGMEKRIKNLEDAIADLKADKVEASKVEEEVKKEVKQKLSTEPAAKAIKHNPEGESSKQVKMHISPKRAMSTRDRVFQKISNLK